MTRQEAITAAMVRAAYAEAFGREPDPAGFEFWRDVLEPLIRPVAQAFAEADEGIKHPQMAEPQWQEVLDGVGAIRRWSIWTHRQSGSLYSVSALGDRITLDLDEVGAFNPGSRMMLPPDNMLAIFEPVDPVEGSRWLDIHGANEGRQGVAQGRERGNMLVFLYDGDAKPVRVHASAFGHRFREV